MPLKFLFAIAITLISNLTYGQYNDSLFYKSGARRAVEIDTVTFSRIKYAYINSKGDSAISAITIGQIKYYKIYSETNSLVFDSRKEYYRGLPGKNQDNLKISKNTFSFSPILLGILTVRTRHNYVFGKYMQWAINTRVTYESPFYLGFGDLGDLNIGTGIKFIPFYNERYSFGVDFTPSVRFYLGDSDSPEFHLPLSINFDFYFRNRLGLALDFGFGPTSNQQIFFIESRGHFGLLWRFKNKKTIETPMMYHVMN